MRALILTCNTGGGHNACAKALQQYYLDMGDSCDIADALSFVSEKFSRFMSWGHSTMYRRIPGLFKWGYGFTERHPSTLEENGYAGRLFAMGTEKLYGFIVNGGYENVICTHVFSALLAGNVIRNYSLKIKTCFVATDYTCSPGTSASGLDYYFIPDESLTDEFVSQGIPKEKIIASGIPVKKEFYNKVSKPDAKSKFGIMEDGSHLVMMCGSMGCGPMEELAEALSAKLSDRRELSIVCGTNEKLREELSERYRFHPFIHVLGYVENMSLLLDSADLLLTKPGGLSTTEAAVKALPMVLVNAVAGCEEYNMNFFLGKGGASTADSTEKLAELCRTLMDTPGNLLEMSKSLDDILKKNAAKIIHSKTLYH